MPRWVWFTLLPILAYFSCGLTIVATRYVLSPFHLPPASYYGDISGPSALEYNLSAFLGSFLLGLGWSYLAPMSRFFAAMWVAMIYGLPCCFCTSFDWEGPPREVTNISLFWMVVGCVVPILVYCYVDREELKNARI